MQSYAIDTSTVGGLQKGSIGTEFTLVPNHSVAGNCKVPKNNIQPEQLQVLDSLRVKGLADGKKRVFRSCFGPARSKVE